MLSSGPVGSIDTSGKAEGPGSDALRSWYRRTPAARKNVEVASTTTTEIRSAIKTPAHNSPAIAPNRPSRTLKTTNRLPAQELYPDHTARKTTNRNATCKKRLRISSRL